MKKNIPSFRSLAPFFVFLSFFLSISASDLSDHWRQPVRFPSFVVVDQNNPLVSFRHGLKEEEKRLKQVLTRERKKIISACITGMEENFFYGDESTFENDHLTAKSIRIILWYVACSNIPLTFAQDSQALAKLVERSSPSWKQEINSIIQEALEGIFGIEIERIIANSIRDRLYYQIGSYDKEASQLIIHQLIRTFLPEGEGTWENFYDTHFSKTAQEADKKRAQSISFLENTEFLWMMRNKASITDLLPTEWEERINECSQAEQKQMLRTLQEQLKGGIDLLGKKFLKGEENTEIRGEYLAYQRNKERIEQQERRLQSQRSPFFHYPHQTTSSLHDLADQFEWLGRESLEKLQRETKTFTEHVEKYMPCLRDTYGQPIVDGKSQHTYHQSSLSSLHQMLTRVEEMQSKDPSINPWVEQQKNALTQSAKAYQEFLKHFLGELLPLLKQTHEMPTPTSFSIPADWKCPEESLLFPADAADDEEQQSSSLPVDEENDPLYEPSQELHFPFDYL